MSIIQNIRPIEALYLLDHAEIETMTTENSLAANLGYLAHKWFISLKDSYSHTHLDVSEVGKGVLNSTIDRAVINSMRPYEINSLKAILDDNEYHLLSTVADFDFKNRLTKEGFFRINNKLVVPQISFLKFITTKEYIPTEKYSKTIEELKDLRSELVNHAFTDNNNRYITPMIYAFPSLGLVDAYSQIAKTLYDDGSFASLEFKYPAPGFIDTDPIPYV